MKIKRKLEKNLPQLIEWVIENKKFGFTYVSDKFNKVYVTDDGIIEFNGSFYRDIFTIIIFEEITEDKWFPELVIRTVAGGYILHKQGSINDFKHSTFNDVEAFYIPNDDLTLTLIWTREKGLVK